jgi:hypothetical protein
VEQVVGNMRGQIQSDNSIAKAGEV